MSVSFKNFCLSQYEGIDYNISHGEKTPIPQTYFKCSKADNGGRLTSLIDTVSQVAKLIFGTIIMAVAAPVLIGVFALGAVILLPVGIISTEAGMKVLVLSKAAGFCGGAAFVFLPLNILFRIFVLATNILGIISPKIGQFGRLKGQDENFLGMFFKEGGKQCASERIPPLQNPTL